LFLQINECPIGQTTTYTAAVYAIRYRIYTGWHSLKLPCDVHCVDREADRLDSWLHARWFESLVSRRQFRTLHPECSAWSWKRIGQESPPYEVVDAARCVTIRSGSKRGRGGGKRGSGTEKGTEKGDKSHY
jgi:hypothetical protein